jgi:hypothetical protein
VISNNKQKQHRGVFSVCPPSARPPQLTINVNDDMNANHQYNTYLSFFFRFMHV